MRYSLRRRAGSLGWLAILVIVLAALICVGTVIWASSNQAALSAAIAALQNPPALSSTEQTENSGLPGDGGTSQDPPTGEGSSNADAFTAGAGGDAEDNNAAQANGFDSSGAIPEQIINPQKQAFDCGDQFYFTVCDILHGPSKTRVVIVTKPGQMLNINDGNADNAISGTVEYVIGEEEQVLNYAESLGAPNQFITGDSSRWTKLPEVFGAFEFKVVPYEEQHLEIEGSVWSAPTTLSLAKHKLGKTGVWTVCQLWNGVDPSTVYHFWIVPNGSIELSTSMQGTCWEISNVTDATFGQLLLRAEQMKREVLLRDNPAVKTVYLIAGGVWNNIPNGWVTPAQTGVAR